MTLVGAGPGDPALLTLGALHALRAADVVLYDALVSDAVVALAPDSAECIHVGKRGGEHTMAQREIEALMIARAREGKRVVRLKGGDPFVFGRGGEEARALRAADIEFRVVPGVTSAIAAAAYAGVPVTDRRYASSFVVATGHEDPTKEGSALDWSALAAAPTLVVMMGIERLGNIVEELVAHGASAATPAAVVQDGTLPTQRCVVATLGSIAEQTRDAGIRAPAVLIVGSVVTLREELRWFDSGPLFGKRILVTRPAGAQRFARALMARGAQPVIAPTVRIAAPDDPEIARREIARLNEYDWIVFLSRTGIDLFFRALHEREEDARAIGKARVAAIGPKSAERLADHGVLADLVSGRSTSEDVAHDLLERTRPGQKILIFAAQEGRDIVRSLLEEAMRVPVAVPAYKSLVVSDPEFATTVASCDILTFTNGSTVRGFATLLGGNAAAVSAARGKIVACIGPITAGEAEEIGLHVDVVPKTFSTDALIEALEERAATPA